MPRTVSLEEAERDLSHLIHRAAGGEDVVIVAADGVRARLVTLPVNAAHKRRPAHALKLSALADDFEAPLDAETLATFEIPLKPA